MQTHLSLLPLHARRTGSVLGERRWHYADGAEDAIGGSLELRAHEVQVIVESHTKGPHLGEVSYEGGIVENVDPRGTAYYWIGGTPIWADDDGADQTAVARGEVSITPLMLDLTDRGCMADLARLVATRS